VSALGSVVRAGVGRRRVQTLVMTLTTLVAVTASVLAAGLLLASAAPFEKVFDAQNGAHLSVRFDGPGVSAEQIAATAHASGVTGAAGPFPVLTVAPTVAANSSDMPVDSVMPTMTVAGRSTPHAGVDDLVLTDGRWATGPGQVVLDAKNAPMAVGDHIRFPDAPGAPTLTVVGIARSATASADAWVSPAEVAALAPAGTEPGEQMLYRFASAGTDAEVAADRAAIAAAVPAGSVTQAASYLPVKTASEKTTAPYVPFVVAFAVLGLAMSILIIGIVVSGAVGSATRRIGILKAVGFTPAQVVRAYIVQALLPASVGTVAGLLAGNAAAVVVLGTAGRAFGTGTQAVAPWIDVAVPVVVLAAVAASALVPALRAGRLRTVEALTLGRSGGTGRGRLIGERLGALPLPRPLSLGLAAPFRRPARAATMTAAVTLGAIGATFGVGLALSLNGIAQGMGDRQVGDVVVKAVGGPSAHPAPKGSRGHRDPNAASLPGLSGGAGFQPAAYTGPAASPVVASPKPVSTDAPDPIAKIIAAQPGTLRWFGTGTARLGVAGLAGVTPVATFSGDSSWGPHQLVSGSWFHGPGEAVVPSGFLSTTGTRVGDTITLTDNGHQAPVRIVGEVFDLQDGGMMVMTDVRSLAGLGAVELPASIHYDIEVAPGVSVDQYVYDLDAALQPTGAGSHRNQGVTTNTVVLAMDTLAAMLMLLLLVTAGLGVLNTVVLDTRERVHDLGVFKALGMSPRQTMAMVLTSVAGVGLVAGAIGVPIGVVLHGIVLPAMGHAAGTRIPGVDIAVYSVPLLGVLVLGGLLIAVAGALAPAGWAARARTAVALRTE